VGSDLNATLGPQVAHFIGRFGVHGPGDKIGEPFELSIEELGFLYRAYEITEDAYRPGRWRRQYRHGIYCRRKGMRKSELMAQVTLAEFDGPVRFSGEWARGGEVDEWGYEFAAGEPIGRRVVSPEIPVVATTEDQAEKLVWGVIRYVFMNTPLASRYKVQEDQIFFAGKAKEEGWAFTIPPTNSKAADGAKPTFIPREEAHLWTTADLIRTADVMDRNAIKRQAADPWTMDATTTYAPGEGSVLERSLKSLKAGDTSVLLDLLQASERWNLDDEEQWLKAVEEASGDAWPWTNIAGMRSLFLDPEKSRASFCRFQLNQAKAIENKPFSGEKFDLFAAPERTPGPSRRVPLVLFLDGALTRDSTALIAWTVEERPHLFLAGLWERPDASMRVEWHVPKGEVVARVEALWDDYCVVFVAGNSNLYWAPELRAWEERWSDDRVVQFNTSSGTLMDGVTRRWEEEWNVGLARAGEGGVTPWTHDGSPELRAHLAATVVEQRGKLRSIAKASEGLGDKIDAARAAICGAALIPEARAKAGELLAGPVEAGIW
jgi:hypothetical protein